MAVTASLVGFEQSGTNVTFGTVAGDTAILIACLDTSGDNNTLSCTWDTGLGANQAMTRIRSALSGDGNKITLFGLVNPSIVTNASVVITGWSGDGILTSNFLSFQGTITTTTAACFTNSASNTGASNSLSITITSAVGDLVAAAFEAGFPGVTSTNGTEWFPSSAGPWTGSYAIGAASVTLTAAIGGAPNWASIGVNVVQGVVRPNALSDWPVPRRRAVPLQHWQQSLRLPSWTPPPPLPPHQYDWPVPKGPQARLRAPVDWVTGSTWQVTQPLPTLPARTFDWPNPRGPLYRVEDFQLSYVQIAVLPPPLFPATYQFDWPNPTLRKPPAVVDWLQSATWLLSQPPPSLPAGRQLDWPNPTRAQPPVVVDWLAWSQSIQNQPPLIPFDWPNPRGPKYPVWDWISAAFPVNQPLPTRIVGRLQDWPNPLLRATPIVRDWVVGSTRTVTAPSPVMPMARPRDWPNPRGANPNQGLGRINVSVMFTESPPQGPTETLKNLSGRVRFLENEVGRVRWLKRLKL